MQVTSHITHSPIAPDRQGNGFHVGALAMYRITHHSGAQWLAHLCTACAYEWTPTHIVTRLAVQDKAIEACAECTQRRAESRAWRLGLL